MIEKNVGGTAFRRTLLSSKENLNLESFSAESGDFSPSFPSGCRIEKRRLRGGKQEGVDLVTLDNGRVRIRIIPTRGMGILDVTMGDLRLGWDSPVKEVVHPSLINLQSRAGLGWLEGFNEWLVRCGLESAGEPGPDNFINNQGNPSRMDLTLHGKIANIPASQVEIEVEQRAPFTMRVRGRVLEGLLFGPQLELQTEITTIPGSSEFTVEDRITNLGSRDQEFQLIYHINCGWPLLGEGASFAGCVSRVFPMNQRAAEGIDRYGAYSGPESGFIEQVYCMDPAEDSAGKTSMLLTDGSGRKGMLLRYPVKDLPSFSLWKNLNSLADGYVTGFEPGTGFPYRRESERKAGRVPKLEPSETRTFSLQFRLLEDAAAVQAAAGDIRDFVRRHPAQILRVPPASHG